MIKDGIYRQMVGPFQKMNVAQFKYSFVELQRREKEIRLEIGTFHHPLLCVVFHRTLL